MTDGCRFVFRLSNGTILTAQATNKWNSLLSSDGILTEQMDAIQDFIRSTEEGEKKNAVGIFPDSLLVVMDFQTHKFYNYDLKPYTDDESFSWHNYLKWAKESKNGADELNRLIGLFKAKRITKVIQDAFNNANKKREIIPPFTNEAEFVQFLEETSDPDRKRGMSLPDRLAVTQLVYDISPFTFEVYEDRMKLYQRLKDLGFAVCHGQFENFGWYP